MVVIDELIVPRDGVLSQFILYICKIGKGYQ